MKKTTFVLLLFGYIFIGCNKDDNPSKPNEIPNTIHNIEMVTVQGGTFMMGSNVGYFDQQPIHSVTLSTFKISKYEITQKLWLEVMGTNPSYFTGDLNRPVESISWNDVQQFITKLNQLTGKSYRLPTEAEWEYAARGGNQSHGYIYAGSDYIGDVAWYRYNSENTSHPVGTKAPNELGIYDMSGNVWEWCSDWYDSGYYSVSPSSNPKGPSSGQNRVLRGGSYSKFGNSFFRSDNRSYGIPDFPYVSSDEGVRLVENP